MADIEQEKFADKPPGKAHTYAFRIIFFRVGLEPTNIWGHPEPEFHRFVLCLKLKSQQNNDNDNKILSHPVNYLVKGKINHYITLLIFFIPKPHESCCSYFLILAKNN